jgi:Na+/pantothenate symporter
MLTYSAVLAEGSNAALVTFMIYTLAVFGLAALSNQLLKSKSFLSEYFLGSRSLGVWAFALTFAATSSSGGSFTGFPAKIYTHGWILALWIGSYMVVPICAMGLIGKRLNQVARISSSITVPDVLRDRFNSQRFGLMAVVLIVFFMSFNLVAQFKAGALILKVLLKDVDLFHSVSASAGQWTAGIDFLGSDPGYLVCLLFFGVAVIVYTTYGGFHAVVWTDVMQGIVMVIGVLILLPLALNAAGGLENATKELAKMTPPRRGLATIHIDEPLAQPLQVTRETWLRMERDAIGTQRVFRVAKPFTVAADADYVHAVELLEITTPAEIERILAGTVPAEFDIRLAVATFQGASENYGVVTVSLTTGSTPAIFRRGDVVGVMTEEGGKRSFVVAVDTPSTGEATELTVTEPESVFLRNGTSAYDAVATKMAIKSVSYKYGADKPGVYVTGPGPSPTNDVGFLGLSIAISFFFMWAISGAGQPSNMVRLMAFKDSKTLKRSIFTVAIYYTAIYLPLVFIFVCARVIMPGMEVEPDGIMPEIAVYLTNNIGAAWLGGLLIAAPFAAVMSTVDSFLLMISSAVVRDIYQRNINPEAQEKTLKYLSYLCTLLVGSIAMVVAINPPDFLQDIIVYVGSGLAACFLAPVVFLLYWPRATETGCIAGMMCGFGAHFGMYLTGMFVNGSFFRPYQLFNFNPIIVGLFVSFLATYLATRASAPPPEELVRKYFCRKTGEANS